MASGLGVGLAGCKSALNPRLFILLAILWRWYRCWSYSLLLCDLFYEAICFMSYLVLFLFLWFSVLLALRLPRLGKRELISVLFVGLFDLRLFVLSVSPSSCCLGRAAVCDCGTPWTFLLSFFSYVAFCFVLICF